MKKAQVNGRQNIRTPNGKLHDDAGLKALDGIFTEEYYVKMNYMQQERQEGLWRRLPI